MEPDLFGPLRHCAWGFIFLLATAAYSQQPQQSPPPAPAQTRITLEQALQLASKHNHSLEAARTGIDQNLAQEVTANLRPKPTLSWGFAVHSSFRFAGVRATGLLQQHRAVRSGSRLHSRARSGSGRIACSPQKTRPRSRAHRCSTTGALWPSTWVSSSLRRCSPSRCLTSRSRI